MAVDVLHEYSDKQSVVLNSGVSAVSTNVDYNAVAPEDAWGVSKALEIGSTYWIVEVTTATVGAGATLVCELRTKAADGSLSSGATLIASYTFPAASAIGSRHVVKLGEGTERLAYLGVLYTASGGNITAGNVNSRLGSAPAITD